MSFGNSSLVGILARLVLSVHVGFVCRVKVVLRLSCVVPDFGVFKVSCWAFAVLWILLHARTGNDPESSFIWCKDVNFLVEHTRIVVEPCAYAPVQQCHSVF